MTRHRSDGHLTEGQIHAWLDGELDAVSGAGAATAREHLEACASCRARADEEAALRERASHILSDAAPAVAPLPSFEALRERARDGAPPASGSAARRGRHRRWAWAASVVVALGLGWALRDQALPPASEAPSAAGAAQRGEALGAPSARASEAAGGGVPAEAAPAGAPGLASARPETSEAAAVGGADVPRAAPADEARAPSAPLPRRTMADAGDPAGAQPSADADLASERQPSGADVAREERALAPPPPPPSPDRALAADRGSEAASVPEKAGAPLPSQAVAVAGDTSVGDTGRIGRARLAESASAAGTAEPAPTADEAPVMLGLDAIVVTGAPGPDTTSAAVPLPEGRRVTAQAPRPAAGRDAVRPLAAAERRRVREAAAEAGAAAAAPADSAALVLVAPGLEVLSVTWGDVAPGVRGVRVLQRLEPSDTLELVVIPGGPDDGAAEAALASVLQAPLPPGWSRIVRVRDGARIVARAPLPAGALSRLVEEVGRR